MMKSRPPRERRSTTGNSVLNAAFVAIRAGQTLKIRQTLREESSSNAVPQYSLKYNNNNNHDGAADESLNPTSTLTM